MPDDALSTVEKLYIGVQLTRPLLRNITARVDADLKGTGISVGQRAILDVLLAMDQATAPEITTALQLKRQFVARELQELTKTGMVQSAPNPRHKTSRIYTLSQQAHRVITQIRHRETKQFAEFAGRFTPEEIDAFYRVQVALNAEMVGS
jgi:DNA-binding MarR family transcriptional regulator